MQIFPHSPDKKKEIYPSYMVRTAAIDGVDMDVDEAFEAIRELPGLEGPPCEEPPCEEPVVEEQPEPVAVEGDESAPPEPTEGESGEAAAVEKAQEAVSDAQEAVEEAAAAVEEVAMEVVSAEPEAAEEEGGEAEEGEENGGAEEGEEAAEIEIEIEGPEEEEAPGEEEIMKEGVEGCSGPMPAEETPVITEQDIAPQASTEGDFERIAHLSPQNKKEVYDYWVALGLPQQWCKALTKNYE